MRYIIVLLLFFSSFVSFAQPEDAVKVNVDGISYYQHTVVAGNTLYGLQKTYGASVEEIMKLNPELEDGLKVGQKVLIPILEDPNLKTVAYKVKKKETLYGLSKKFNISIDELIRLNPSLKDGLKKGQVIFIPESNVPDEIEIEENISRESSTPNPFVIDTIIEDGYTEEVIVSFQDSIVKHTVLQGETMYSISKRFMVPIEEIVKVNGLSSTTVHPGQVLSIPIKKEKVDKVVIKSIPKIYDPNSLDSIIFEEKDEYNVVIMLPFHLDHGKKYSKYVSNLATQFYMGAKIALDSLEDLGMKAKVYVYDTKNDSSTIASLLNLPVFENVDVVIGPLLSKEVKQVALFCRQNKIRMVCPVSTSSDVLENNRLVYTAVTSNVTLENGMADFLTKKAKTDRVIVVKPSDEKSLAYYEAFVNTYRMKQSENSPVLIEATMNDFNIHIQKRNKSHIVMPTIDKNVALKFINSLNKSSFRANPGNIIIYGMKEWVDFKEINTMYKNKYNLHFATPYYLNYNLEKLVSFNKMYRSIYKTDLSKMAIQGFDVTKFYLSSFLLKNNSLSLLMNNFDNQQVSEKDGYENSNVFIVEYDDYELLLVE